MTGSDPEAGVPIVLTAPLTEIIDHAGYFIQMSMASLPIWLEGIINKKYPKWREVEYNDDGSARSMPAGIRVLEDVAAPALSGSRRGLLLPGRSRQIHRSEDPRRGRVHPQSAGRHLRRRRLHVDFRIVEAMPINSHYSRELFAHDQGQPHRDRFKVIVGGSGGWQIDQTNSYEELSVDCIVEGRSESVETLEPVRQGAEERASAPPDRRAASRRIATASCFQTAGRRSASSR